MLPPSFSWGAPKNAYPEKHVAAAVNICIDKRDKAAKKTGDGGGGGQGVCICVVVDKLAFK